MAKVTIPSISVGDAITTTDLNTFISQVNAVPTSGLNEDNIQNEGIDRRNIKADQIQSAETTSLVYFSFANSYSNSTTSSGRTSAAYQIVGSGFFSPITLGGGSSNPGVTVDVSAEAGDWILATCSFSFHTNLDPNNVVGGAPRIGFAIFVDNLTLGTSSIVSGSRREYSNWMRTRDSAGTLGTDGYFAINDTCTIVAPLLVGGAYDFQFELRGLKDRTRASGFTSDEVYLQDITFSARVIKR